MKAFTFLVFIILLSLQVIGYNSCLLKADTSYLDDAYNYSGNNKYLEETTSTFDGNSVKISCAEMYGNTITIPVKINRMMLDMIFDTGASSTGITLTEADYLYEKGLLIDNDIVGFQQFQTADRIISVGLRVILRDVAIGDEIISRDFCRSRK